MGAVKRKCDIHGTQSIQLPICVISPQVNFHTWTWEYLLAVLSLMNFSPKQPKSVSLKSVLQFLRCPHLRNTDPTDTFNYVVIFMKPWAQFPNAVAAR